ncbi:MAG: hypothetical protein AAGB28_13640 [Pseudomonadota bacterium]
MLNNTETSHRSTAFSMRDLGSIIAGGVGGLLLQSATVTAYVGAPYLKLITTWGRYVVAILLVALFATLWRMLPRTQSIGLSLLAGITIPSLLSRYMFASAAPWSLLITFNLIFTVLALTIWRLSLKRLGG